MTVAQVVTTSPVDIALRKSIKSKQFYFEPPIQLVCQKLGIVPPEECPEIEREGSRYRVFRFVWPDDAAAFLKHFVTTHFAPTVL